VTEETTKSPGRYPTPHYASARRHRPCICIDLVAAGWRPGCPLRSYTEDSDLIVPIQPLFIPIYFRASIPPYLDVGLGPVFISVHHCAKIRMSDEMADPSLHTLMFCQASVVVAALLLQLRASWTGLWVGLWMRSDHLSLVQ
jgi:hypothetical protein